MIKETQKKGARRLSGILLTLLILTYGCSESVPEKGAEVNNVSISFTPADTEGGRIASDLVPKSAIVTLRNTGNSVISHNKARLDLLAFGDGYITKELEILEGTYQIEDFLVVNESDEIIYLTPKEYSEFADLVNDPLPITFSTAGNETTDVQLEVIPSDLGDPVKYGYTTFSFGIVNNLEKGLVAHYSFNNDINDSSPNYHDLSLTEPVTIPYTTDRKGDTLSAILFDGTFGCVVHQVDSFDQAEPQTMSFWMKTGDTNSDTNFGGGMVRVYTTGSSRFYTSIRDSQFQLNYGASASPPYGDVFYQDTLISDSEWKHVVFVSYGNDQNGSFYVNGIKVADLTFSVDNSGTLPGVAIGGNDFNSYYIGALDDVRLYNRALTHDEVLQLYIE